MSKFGMTSEYICIKAREMLWDEEKPYKEVLEYLHGSFGCDDMTKQELDDLYVAILEGRKIIKDWDIEDDNTEIRPIAFLLDRQNEELRKFRLKEDINANPIKYQDPLTFETRYTFYNYEGYSSLDGRVSPLSNVGSGLTIEQIGRYRVHHSTSEFIEHNKAPIEDEELTPYFQHGMYLAKDIELAFKVLGGPCKDNVEVAYKITTYFNEQLRLLKEAGISYEDMNGFQKAIYKRNYMACAFGWYGYLNHSDLVFPYFDMRRLQSSTSPENIKRIGIRKSVEHLGIGWISPDGTFYECDFGHHISKARDIVCDKFSTEFILYFGKNKVLENLSIEEDYCLADFLLEKGWVQFHNPEDRYSPYAQMKIGKEPNSRQVNTIYDLFIKYKFPYDPISRVRVDWDRIDNLQEVKI